MYFENQEVKPTSPPMKNCCPSIEYSGVTEHTESTGGEAYGSELVSLLRLPKIAPEVHRTSQIYVFLTPSPSAT